MISAGGGNKYNTRFTGKLDRVRLASSERSADRDYFRQSQACLPGGIQGHGREAAGSCGAATHAVQP